MQRTGKKLLACSLAAAVMSITGTALAGQEPYVATVGADSGDSDGLFTNPADPKRQLSFYVSPKVWQFTQHDCTPDGVSAGEFFGSFTSLNATGGVNPITQPEICDTAGQHFGGFVFRGDWNARLSAAQTGSYRWTIALPKRPNGPINLVLECGILKRQAFSGSGFGFHAVKQCAGYTGEKTIAPCGSNQDPEGSISPGILPTLQAWGVKDPGTPFQTAVPLWAYRNPGNYTLESGLVPITPVSVVPTSGYVATNARIALKACMDKTVVVQLPQGDHLLNQGDLINVILNVPANHGVDIYCSRDSLKVQGIGEPNC